MNGSTNNSTQDQEKWEERFHLHSSRDDDPRTHFDIDMARIIHSAAFRRLQGKTQILGLGESDFYRTRLTHSIEVAQIANGIVCHLKKGKDNLDDKLKDLLPETSLITAISLAHDIGHPPFGHGGEIALNFLMRKHGGFEGNAQTLRLVHLLEPRSELGGINLTRRTLLGLIKYPAKYSIVHREMNPEPENATLNFSDIKLDEWKPPKCYYDEEQPLFDWILNSLSSSDRRQFSQVKLGDLDSISHKKTCYKSLDTSIMEIADDISYGVHDLEDAIEMRLIFKEDWERESKKCFKNIDSDWLIEHLSLEEIEKKEARQLLTDKLFGDTWERKDAIGAMVKTLITQVEHYEISTFSEPLLQHNIRIKAGPADDLLKCLKKVVSKKVIKSANVQTLEYRGLRMVAELFQALRTNPDRLLPESTQNKIKNRGISLERGIADYIAGMTDEYATKMYERLFIPREGTIHQLL